MAANDKLISANALLEKVQFRIKAKGVVGATIKDMVGIIRKLIDEAPAVEAVKVVHGQWYPHFEVFDDDPSVGVLGGRYQTGWQCSVCGRYEYDKEPYCNCGAKMDGGAHNEI